MDMNELIKKVEYLSDMEEIRSLQGKYQYLLLRQEGKRIADECFVRHTPGGMIEASDSGAFCGVEGIHRFFEVHMPLVWKKTGFFTAHMSLNPYVWFSEDRNSAKAVWWAPGYFGCKGADDAIVLGIYLIDYYREDGQWRIWKCNMTPFFRTPYHEGWGRVPVSNSVRDGLQDIPPTAWNPYDPDKTGEELFCHLWEIPADNLAVHTAADFEDRFVNNYLNNPEPVGAPKMRGEE